MANETFSADILEGAKLRFEALLAEYNSLRNNITKRREMQGQTENIALAGLGVSIPVILTILERNPNAVGALLLIPVLFFAIAFTQLRHERALLIMALYVDSELRPKVNEILTQITKTEASVFEYEGFLSRHSWAPHLLLEWLAITSRAALSLSFGSGIIVTYLYLRVAIVNAYWPTYEIGLLVIDILILIGDLTIALFIARKRYSYLRHNYYNVA